MFKKNGPGKCCCSVECCHLRSDTSFQYANAWNPHHELGDGLWEGNSQTEMFSPLPMTRRSFQWFHFAVGNYGPGYDQAQAHKYMKWKVRSTGPMMTYGVNVSAYLTHLNYPIAGDPTVIFCQGSCGFILDFYRGKMAWAIGGSEHPLGTIVHTFCLPKRTVDHALPPPTQEGLSGSGYWITGDTFDIPGYNFSTWEEITFKLESWGFLYGRHNLVTLYVNDVAVGSWCQPGGLSGWINQGSTSNTSLSYYTSLLHYAGHSQITNTDMQAGRDSGETTDQYHFHNTYNDNEDWTVPNGEERVKVYDMEVCHSRMTYEITGAAEFASCAQQNTTLFGIDWKPLIPPGDGHDVLDTIKLTSLTLNGVVGANNTRSPQDSFVRDPAVCNARFANTGFVTGLTFNDPSHGALNYRGTITGPVSVTAQGGIIEVSVPIVFTVDEEVLFPPPPPSYSGTMLFYSSIQNGPYEQIRRTISNDGLYRHDAFWSSAPASDAVATINTIFSALLSASWSITIETNEPALP